MRFDVAGLPRDRLVEPAGRGWAAAMSSIDLARINAAACAVGLARSALQIALTHTSRRTLFGSTTLELQAVRFALADVETDIIAGRLLYQRAASPTSGSIDTTAVAHAKRFCSDSATRAVATCTSVMGGAWVTARPPDASAPSRRPYVGGR